MAAVTSSTSLPGSPEGGPPALPTSALALREDQVANAVAFLTHPKVRAGAALQALQRYLAQPSSVIAVQVQGSSQPAKRSFLEGKGLTAAEIQEALNRVPAGVHLLQRARRSGQLC